ncbi:MAG: hypothetical protein IJK36_05545 [Bacteroidales bacterium]|nr:hypothetical protein [Bacteroidales bacterium]
MPTPQPQLTYESYRSTEYQSQTESHIRESFGFREPLIRFFDQFLYDFFHTTYNEEVVVGKDHWFYFKQHVNEYYGTEMYRWYGSSEEACADFDREARLMWKLRGVLKEYGIEFLMFMAPDKGFLYPEHMPYRKHDTTTVNAREYYSAKFDDYGFPYIEMTKWFIELKKADTLPYSLFSQSGAHWGFSAALATDSLLRFMENLKGEQLPRLHFGPLRESSEATLKGDHDLENTVNLMRPVPHDYDRLYDAEVTVVTDPTTIKPNVLFVGNSFLRRMHYYVPFDDVFSYSEYWYYNSTAYYGKKYSKNANVFSLDILQKILDADYVVWFTDGNQMYKTSYMFVETALLNLCIDDDLVQETRDYILDSLGRDSLTLLNTANMNEKERGSLLWSQADKLLKKNLEYYFPDLAGNSIPVVRNSRVTEALVIKRIKKDPKWMMALCCQSIIQDLPLDDILKIEAKNILCNGLLMRDMKESISREVYIEYLVREMIEEISGKPELLEKINKKALENGKSFEDQLRGDARWLINEQIKKGTIVLEE